VLSGMAMNAAVSKIVPAAVLVFSIAAPVAAAEDEGTEGMI
jgi:hypothetical protein